MKTKQNTNNDLDELIVTGQKKCLLKNNNKSSFSQVNDNANDSLHSTVYQFGRASKNYILDPKLTPQFLDHNHKTKIEGKKEKSQPQFKQQFQQTHNYNFEIFKQGWQYEYNLEDETKKLKQVLSDDSKNFSKSPTRLLSGTRHSNSDLLNLQTTNKRNAHMKKFSDLYSPFQKSNNSPNEFPQKYSSINPQTHNFKFTVQIRNKKQSQINTQQNKIKAPVENNFKVTNFEQHLQQNKAFMLQKQKEIGTEMKKYQNQKLLKPFNQEIRTQSMFQFQKTSVPPLNEESQIANEIRQIQKNQDYQKQKKGSIAIQTQNQSSLEKFFDQLQTNLKQNQAYIEKFAKIIQNPQIKQRNLTSFDNYVNDYQYLEESSLFNQNIHLNKKSRNPNKYQASLMTPVINERKNAFTDLKYSSEFQKSTFFTSGTDNNMAQTKKQFLPQTQIQRFRNTQAKTIQSNKNDQYFVLLEQKNQNEDKNNHKDFKSLKKKIVSNQFIIDKFDRNLNFANKNNSIVIQNNINTISPEEKFQQPKKKKLESLYIGTQKQKLESIFTNQSIHSEIQTSALAENNSSLENLFIAKSIQKLDKQKLSQHKDILQNEGIKSQKSFEDFVQDGNDGYDYLNQQSGNIDQFNQTNYIQNQSDQYISNNEDIDHLNLTNQIQNQTNQNLENQIIQNFKQLSQISSQFDSLKKNLRKKSIVSKLQSLSPSMKKKLIQKKLKVLLNNDYFQGFKIQENDYQELPEIEQKGKNLKQHLVLFKNIGVDIKPTNEIKLQKIKDKLKTFKAIHTEPQIANRFIAQKILKVDTWKYKDEHFKDFQFRNSKYKFPYEYKQQQRKNNLSEDFCIEMGEQISPLLVKNDILLKWEQAVNDKKNHLNQI